MFNLQYCDLYLIYFICIITDIHCYRWEYQSSCIVALQCFEKKKPLQSFPYKISISRSEIQYQFMFRAYKVIRVACLFLHLRFRSISVSPMK